MRCPNCGREIPEESKYCLNCAHIIKSLSTDEFQQAIELETAGKLTEAEDVYKSIIREDPQHPLANRLLGDLFFREGRLSLAARHFYLLTKRNVQDGGAWFNLGETFFYLGKMKNAAYCFEQVTSLTKEWSLAWYWLGRCYFHLGEEEKAIRAYDEAFALASELTAAIYQKGRIAINRGEWDSALELFQRVLKREPKDSRSHFYMGLALSKLGRRKEAIRSLEKARDLDPENTYAARLLDRLKK